MYSKIIIKRIYDETEASDGYRILVDRLWPRGISKEKAAIDLWAKEIAPSHELRKWFHANLDQFNLFETKYLEELKGNKELIHHYFNRLEVKSVCLLYSTKNVKQNHAQILKKVLERDFLDS